MDQNLTPPLMCTNCQAVTTADGKTLWVCENCGTDNHPVAAPVAPEVSVPEISVPEVTLAPETPVVPEVTAAPMAPVASPAAPVLPDATMAQADIDLAAQTVTAPIPEIPVVGLGDVTSPVMGGSAPPMPPGPVIGR